jgi:hypothetical protein
VPTLVANTQIKHGQGDTVTTYQAGDEIPEDALSEQDIDGLLSVDAITVVADAKTKTAQDAADAEVAAEAEVKAKAAPKAPASDAKA